MDRLLYRNYISGYGEIMVSDSYFHGQMTRLLLVDGAMQSASYNEPEHRDELIFEYMKGFDFAQGMRPESRRTLLIGGGAMSYPKHFAKNYGGKSLDVVEICPEMLDIARRYFYYDEQKAPSIRTYVCDGDEFLYRTADKYDIILNDAYIGPRWDKDNASTRHCRLVRSRLSQDGIYVLNVITAQRGLWGTRGKKMMDTLKRFFRRTMLIPCQDEKDLYYKQNCLIFATDGDLFTK